jgi:hypothetical protein
MNVTHEGMWTTENILSFSHPLVLFVRVLARGAVKYVFTLLCQVAFEIVVLPDGGY